jgi:hypothetical protein
MNAKRSDSFRVFKATQTLQDLADKVPEMTKAKVKFVVIDEREGRFGVWEVDRLSDDLEGLKAGLDVGLDEVKLIAVLPHLKVAALDLSGCTDDEIDDLVDVEKRVIGIRVLRKGAVPRAIYSALGTLGGEGLLGGLPSTLYGEGQPTEGSKYTLKRCPHSECAKPYLVPLKEEGKDVCPHCRREV